MSGQLVICMACCQSCWCTVTIPTLTATPTTSGAQQDMAAYGSTWLPAHGSTHSCTQHHTVAHGSSSSTQRGMAAHGSTQRHTTAHGSEGRHIATCNNRQQCTAAGSHSSIQQHSTQQRTAAARSSRQQQPLHDQQRQQQAAAAGSSRT